ncbi:MAG TPA: 50S ribosomal protein L24 [Pyrinomonadaceae bacterium]|nr:50S ribosomal protein L24 [Pyrinomonadaceae bacterium]
MAGTGTKRAKIRKGDQVIVITGRDSGKRGRVLEVLPAKNRVKVEGVAMMKKHQKANPANNRGGGIIDKEAYINISNVQLIDPETGKATRIRIGEGGDGKRQRIATGSGRVIEK